jgi:hypothetical protein
MTTCSVRWRSSGGRGEFEFVPADSLEGRQISIFLEALNVTIDAEVRGVRAQGKPRLRKLDKNNRKKLHLPQLVMALARLPEPAREDHGNTLVFPLENKSFVMNSMDFDVIEDDGDSVTLAPLRVSILHTDFLVDLQDRFSSIAEDIANISEIESQIPDVANAISQHAHLIQVGHNSIEIRKSADNYIFVQAKYFGMTNVGSATRLLETQRLPESDLEDVLTGVEGRILIRLHAYRERDRKFAKMVRNHYKKKGGGYLSCSACGLKPETLYNDLGDKCIEAHHTIPIEELQPDSVTRVDEMVMVCASCHRVIHSRKPCLTIAEVQALRPSA